MAANSTRKPLSALLSQLLVAYTIELDNEFELRMAAAGFLGDRLSLVLWTNLIRFIPAEGISIRDLASRSLSAQNEPKLQMGCLERWGIITLDSGNVPAARGNPHVLRRDGWGSGRGIALSWIVRLTPKGKKATEIWPPLWSEIEDRWERRFGRNDISKLRTTMQNITKHLEVELPLGLPAGIDMSKDVPYPRRQTESRTELPLSALFSQLLLLFNIEFRQRCRVPIELCANVIRVLDKDRYIRVGDLLSLTGGSSEASDIGWILKPYVLLEPDPNGKRGKVLRLSPAGLRAQNAYHKLTNYIETDWEKRFGTAEVHALRSSLENLIEMRKGDKSILSLGLVPPAGVARAGTLVPALGRRDVGVAARKRMHDLVEQTKRFLDNPGETLPHYPMWDMNRGFGP